LSKKNSSINIDGEVVRIEAPNKSKNISRSNSKENFIETITTIRIQKQKKITKMLQTDKHNQSNVPKPEISKENLQVISECFESLVEHRNEVHLFI
jgi:ribosomal protein S8